LTKELSFILLLVFGYFLALYPGLRYTTGADYSNYLDMFNLVKPLFDYSGFSELSNNFSQIHGEFGFLLINSIFKQLNLSFESLLLFIAFLNIIILIVVLTRNSVNPLMSLFIYCSLFYLITQFSQIRMGVAISIFLLSIQYIYNKNFLKFSILILLGSFFFHKILLISYLLFFFRNIAPTYKKGFYYLFFAIILYELNVLSFFLEIFSKFDLRIIQQINHYYQDENYLGLTPPYMTLTFFMYIYIYSIYLLNRNKIYNNYIEYLLVILLIGIFLNISFYEIQIISGRLSRLFISVLILIVPFILYKNKFKMHSYLYFISIFGYLFLRYYRVLFDDKTNLYPYIGIIF
jgi:hypothetical protein